MKKEIFGAILAVVFLSGCYTQLVVVKRSLPPEPVVTYEVDSLGDTVKVVKQTDTVVTNRENCYWARNMWGDPEWRCGNSYYSHSWYLYNDYPWWYNSSPYYYDFSGRCPQYYYWDAGIGNCRRFSGHGYYGWDGNGRGNSRSGGGGSSAAPSPAHRSQVPLPAARSAAPAQNTPQRSTVQKVEAPNNVNNQAPSGGGEPSAASNAPAPSGTIQSSPQPAAPPPPPSGNNGGSGNNDHKHRNSGRF